MSGRFKPYSLIVLGMLVAAFFLNPPVAFATRLPTACNIFDKEQMEKSGPCGHQAVLSKCQSLEAGEGLVSDADLGIVNFMVPRNIHLSFFFPSVIIPNSAPLRC